MKFDFHLPSFLKKLKRKTAVILPKDVGAIIAFLGISKEDTVVEIGGGNGFLTSYLARISKKVITYEKRKDVFEILKQNIENQNLTNVELKNKDGKEADEIADFYIIDSNKATEILEKIFNNVKKGVAAYLPNIEQAKSFHIKSKEYFKNVFTLRVEVEEWEINERRARPKHIQLKHTAFLTFAINRKQPE